VHLTTCTRLSVSILDAASMYMLSGCERASPPLPRPYHAPTPYPIQDPSFDVYAASTGSSRPMSSVYSICRPEDHTLSAGSDQPVTSVYSRHRPAPDLAGLALNTSTYRSSLPQPLALAHGPFPSVNRSAPQNVASSSSQRALSLATDTSRTPAFGLNAALPHEPVAMCVSLPSNTTLLQCGYCDVWVGTTAKHMKNNHAFSVHLTSASCLMVQRCKSATSTASAAPPTINTADATTDCPGIPLEWGQEGEDIHMSYPSHLHSNKLTHGRLKWDVCGMLADVYYVRSRTCTRKSHHSEPCKRCIALRPKIEAKRVSMAKVSLAATSSKANLIYYSAEQMLEGLAAKNDQITRYELEVDTYTSRAFRYTNYSA
jgi:hypothetical protein